MNDSEDIAVIIPSYNRRGHLARAIDSVLNQTIDRLELIVVDDGSTDGTADFVRSLADRRIRLIVLERRMGANAARNAGIAAAIAGIVAFLDSDDVYLPQRLEHALDALRHHPQFDLVLSSFLTIDGKHRSPAVNPDAVLDAASLEEALVAHALFIAGSSLTIRRSLLDAIGGFDPAIHRMQDRDLLLRIARRSGAILTSPIDWHKSTTPHSISSSDRDYLDALANLIDHHPVMVERYRPIVRYLITRPIVAHLLQGDLTTGLHLWRVSRGDKRFRGLNVPSLPSYMRGKRLRGQIRIRLAKDPIAVPQR